jgi:hypothetical protein
MYTFPISDPGMGLTFGWALVGLIIFIHAWVNND